MIKNYSRLRRALEEFGKLQRQYCVSDCPHDARQCPIVEGLRIAKFGDFEFCPWCGSYQAGVYREESQSETELSLGYRYVFEGGWIRAIVEANGTYYRKLMSCPKCQAGKQWSFAYFDYEEGTECHHRLWFILAERYEKLLKAVPESAAKEA